METINVFRALEEGAFFTWPAKGSSVRNASKLTCEGLIRPCIVAAVSAGMAVSVKTTTLKNKNKRS